MHWRDVGQCCKQKGLHSMAVKKSPCTAGEWQDGLIVLAVGAPRKP
jgi:hypothetical protein